MTTWATRSREERGLLNPSFCSMLLWHAARGRVRDNINPLSFEEAFLVLPLVLHRQTREDLPRTLRTSLAVWLDSNPLARGRVANRAKLLVPFTKEALTFAGVHNFIEIRSGQLLPVNTKSKVVKSFLLTTSGEVRECAKKAEFVGKWFAEAGSPATVLALVGVRP